MICKLKFDQQRALPSILPMSVTDCEKMLMESLAHIGSQNEVILIFLVCVMHTEAFSRRVGESRYNIVFYNLCVLVTLISFYPKRAWWSILYSIIVVDSLIVERSWLRNLSSCNQTLHRTHKRVSWLLRKLVLNQRTRLLASVILSLMLFINTVSLSLCLRTVYRWWCHRVAFLYWWLYNVVFRYVDFFDLYLI